MFSSHKHPIWGYRLHFLPKIGGKELPTCRKEQLWIKSRNPPLLHPSYIHSKKKSYPVFNREYGKQELLTKNEALQTFTNMAFMKIFTFRVKNWFSTKLLVFIFFIYFWLRSMPISIWTNRHFQVNVNWDEKAFGSVNYDEWYNQNSLI